MKFDFEFEIKHVGFSADFYDVEPDDLPELTKRLYEQNRDTARIFVQNRDGVAFSAAEMLSWFLEKSGTSLQDHVPRCNARCVCKECRPLSSSHDRFSQAHRRHPAE